MGPCSRWGCSLCKCATFADHFGTRVDRSGGPDACWPWLGAKHPEGYGNVGLPNEDGQGRGKTHKAHRLAWSFASSQTIPSGLDVLHSCDNPVCCNPAHLSIGTNADNMQDAKAKGRIARGERQGCAKLTAAKVREVRAARAGGMTYSALSKAFGLNRSGIHSIITRATWAHVA